MRKHNEKASSAPASSPETDPQSTGPLRDVRPTGPRHPRWVCGHPCCAHPGACAPRRTSPSAPRRGGSGACRRWRASRCRSPCPCGPARCVRCVALRSIKWSQMSRRGMVAAGRGVCLCVGWVGWVGGRREAISACLGEEHEGSPLLLLRGVWGWVRRQGRSGKWGQHAPKSHTNPLTRPLCCCWRRQPQTPATGAAERRAKARTGGKKQDGAEHGGKRHAKREMQSNAGARAPSHGGPGPACP